jgi:hypothetical protein
MKVGIFLSTTSENQEKRKYLDGFAEAIDKVGGDKYFLSKENKYSPCDLAIVFGFYGLSLGEVHKIRKHIHTEHTIKRKKQCIFIDADLFKYLGNQKKNENTHVRISFGSIFFDKAIHFNENSDSKRWELIKTQKQIDLANYRQDGEHILLCLNSNPYIGHGWSAGSVNIYDWAEQKIKEIRTHSDRPILVRFHPKTKLKDQKRIPIQKFIRAAKHNIKFSGGIDVKSPLVLQETSLIDDCNNSWACVIHNTSASVTPIIQGIPTFTDMKNCPIYPISNHRIVNINSPKLVPREQWLYDASYCLWTHEEICNGIVWERFRNRINDRGEFSKKSANKLQ